MHYLLLRYLMRPNLVSFSLPLHLLADTRKKEGDISVQKIRTVYLRVIDT